MIPICRSQAGETKMQDSPTRKRSASNRAPSRRASRKEAFTPKRGRPTAAQVEAINRAILKAALEQFLESGYEGTGMEAVAVRAGISKGTLYARYATKEQLLQAVVEAKVESWSQLYSRNDDLLSEDAAGRLRYHAHTIMTSLGSEELRGFTKMVAGAPASVPAFARAMYETGYRSTVDLLAKEIAELAQSCASPARDPRRVAEMLMAMLAGWYGTQDLLRKVPHEEAIAFADHAVDVVLAGRAAW
jgi:AcrR family transcriptional regulator